MAVSISPNLDFTQLLSQRPPADRANSPTASSNAIPQWNAAPATDSSNDGSPESSFSTALLDVLAQAPTPNSQTLINAFSKSSAASEAPSADATGAASTQTLINQTGKQQPQVSAATTAVPVKTSQNRLSLVLSAQKAEPAKTTKEPVSSDKAQAQPTQQTPESASSNISLAYVILPQPKEAAADPLAAKTDTDGKIGSTDANNATMPKPADQTQLAIAAAPQDAANPAPNLGSNSESLAFQGQLIAPQIAASPVASQPDPAPAGDQTTISVEDQIKSGEPQPGAVKTGGNIQDNSSSAATDQTASQAGLNPVGSGKGQTSGQETKQDGKQADANRTSAEPGALHTESSSTFTPQGTQNNLSGGSTTAGSSKTDAQPIVHQPSTDQTNVKTDMNLKLQSQSGENITVRLTERAGDIQVTVRSTDPSTNAMLRHELPSIQAGLERAGWQFEGSAPQHGQQDSRGSNSQNSDQQKGDQRSGSQEEQKRKNTQQRQWLDLLQ